MTLIKFMKTLYKNLKNCSINERTYLKACQIICIDIFDFKPIKYWLHLTIGFLGFFSLLQTVLFLYKCSLLYFVQFGPIYFILSYEMVSMIFVPLATREVKTKKIDLSLQNQEVMKKNRIILILCMLYSITSAILGLVSAILFVIYSETDANLIYILDLFKNVPYKWRNLLMLGYKFTVFLIGYVGMISPAHYIVYVFIHFKLHVTTLIDNIANIEKYSESTENLDRNINDSINERIIASIKLHVQCCSMLHTILKNISSVVYCFHILGSSTITSFVVVIFMIEDRGIHGWYLRMGIFTITTLLTLAAATISGQHLEDLPSEIHKELVKLKWYEWNKTNKKLYLMFLTNSLISFKIKFSENISVSYTTAIQLLKTFFSAISVVYGLQQSKRLKYS